MAPTFWIPIQGTWGWDESPDNVVWWEDGSPFTEHMKSLGLVKLPSIRPLLWSTNLEGHQVWQRLFHTRGHKHQIWRAGALSVCYFVDGHDGAHPIPYYYRNFISHSHGLQVILHACGTYGLRIRNLISVGSPIRKDMEEVTLRALGNIDNWLHIFDPRKDDTKLWGEVGDGRFRWPWQAPLKPLADELVPVPGAGHSGTLNDPKFFHIWAEHQDWLRLNGRRTRRTN